MKRFLLVIAVSAALGGCAFVNRHVTLAYPPQPPPGLRPATAAASSDPGSRGKVVIVVLLDQRSTKQAIGAVHNGFGMHTADVLANNESPIG